MTPATTDISNKLLGWVITGVGALLTYSAIRNRYPWDVLRDIQGPPIRTAAPKSSSSSSGTSSGGSNATPTPTADFSASVPRIRQIANREIPPELVPIKPSGMLDKDAAAALARAQADVGRDFGNVGSYRSFAVQSALFHGPGNTNLSDGGQRFADPKKSLHVVGLAIDILDSHNQQIADAMTKEGWQHPRPGAEPWHWSYLVRG